MKKIIYSFLLLFLSTNYTKAQQLICPGNYFTNGDFEIGTPTGMPETINLAQGWFAIWATGSLADFYLATTNPLGGQGPCPATGKYASCWISNMNDGFTTYREGMFNQLTTSIHANSGSYTFNFDISNMSGGKPEIGIYGIYNPTNGVGLTPTGPHTPSNMNLFGPSNTVLLGTITVPDYAACANGGPMKQNLAITFPTATTGGFPVNGITHILITHSDLVKSVKAYVGFDNFCLRVTAPTVNTCCPNLQNLLANPGFNQPGSAALSQYVYDASPSTANSISPGEFGIRNGANALAICKNWIVSDHTSCKTSTGQFMIVNGETNKGSNVNNIIWQQTLSNLQVDSNYKFCAYLKNLPACCFDLLPKVRIEVGSLNSNWITINTSADACSWQQVNYNFTATTTSETIRIVLEETGVGDGNDLAIDDIGLFKLPKPTIQTIVAITGNQISASYGTNISNVDDILPSPECGWYWVVGRIDPSTNTFMTTPTVGIGNSGFGGWNLTTSFPGYSFPMGTTQSPIWYGVGFVLMNCNCLAQTLILRKVSADPQGMRVLPDTEVLIPEAARLKLQKQVLDIIKTRQNN